MCCANINSAHHHPFESRPDKIFAVDWALKTNYLSLYSTLFNSQFFAIFWCLAQNCQQFWLDKKKLIIEKFVDFHSTKRRGNNHRLKSKWTRVKHSKCYLQQMSDTESPIWNSTSSLWSRQLGISKTLLLPAHCACGVKTRVRTWRLFIQKNLIRKTKFVRPWAYCHFRLRLSEGTLEAKDKMTSSGEFGNPLRKFKLVFLGEQSGKCQARPEACHVISVCGILTGLLIQN